MVLLSIDGARDGSRISVDKSRSKRALLCNPMPLVLDDNSARPEPYRRASRFRRSR